MLQTAGARRGEPRQRPRLAAVAAPRRLPECRALRDEEGGAVDSRGRERSGAGRGAGRALRDEE